MAGSMKNYRRTNPQILQFMWIAMDIRDTSVPALGDSLILDVVSQNPSNKFTHEMISTELDNAVKDGAMKRDSAGVLYHPIWDDIVPTANSDLYCFECHQCGPVVNCQSCHRVFHRACVELNPSAGKSSGKYSFRCPTCCAAREETLNRAEVRRLLKLVAERLKKKIAWRTLRMIGYLDLKQRNEYFLSKQMDTRILSGKIRDGRYRSLADFTEDVVQLEHNVHIMYGSKDDMVTMVRQMRKDVDAEMREIALCLDCYVRARSKMPDWMTTKCASREHAIMWAQKSTYTFWPVKVLGEGEEGVYEVISFGGRHERSQLPHDRAFPVDFDPKDLGVRMSGPLKKAMEEMDLYRSSKDVALLAAPSNGLASSDMDWSDLDYQIDSVGSEAAPSPASSYRKRGGSNASSLKRDESNASSLKRDESNASSLKQGGSSPKRSKVASSNDETAEASPGPSNTPTSKVEPLKIKLSACKPLPTKEPEVNGRRGPQADLSSTDDSDSDSESEAKSSKGDSSSSSSSDSSSSDEDEEPATNPASQPVEVDEEPATNPASQPVEMEPLFEEPQASTRKSDPMTGATNSSTPPSQPHRPSPPTLATNSSTQSIKVTSPSSGIGSTSGVKSTDTSPSDVCLNGEAETRRLEAALKAAEQKISTLEASFEQERVGLRARFDQEREILKSHYEKRIVANKKLTWCMGCMKEAKFHCCNGQFFCSADCQLRMWSSHRKTCSNETKGAKVKK